ncbi:MULTISPECIES: metalloregulator ArsR/SmtB family transcription factor [unclassified Luteimonas]|uniref:ArsR/SmtB family transcription factor n=1 Tax=unclassified Luteimonas TaxID=2629088 RepID=UPI00160129C9|nr:MULTISPECIES: metalloregulator ArsR/SmtB family transcription factor [unclassified Luteimonas]MBB1472084.1 helix-turn-helix transcriptional regulator [Luteimonas sp. MC1782]MBB6599189.1 helix-turn-helix transcriptional regulator [Luteimonas sp. MC1825]QOC89310.1 helix-turn-helix transcriptional regulator [Luteimonas sp. MC1825]
MELKSATAALAALGHPTRLAVFRLLVEAGPEGHTPGEIMDALSLPGATLSFHLKELTAAGLIDGEAQGRHISYRADFSAMNGLVEFLTRNCCGGDQGRCPPASRPVPAGARKARGA